MFAVGELGLSAATFEQLLGGSGAGPPVHAVVVAVGWSSGRIAPCKGSISVDAVTNPLLISRTQAGQGLGSEMPLHVWAMTHGRGLGRGGAPDVVAVTAYSLETQ